jgi:hypothetical protein
MNFFFFVVLVYMAYSCICARSVSYIALFVIASTALHIVFGNAMYSFYLEEMSIVFRALD